MRLHKKPKGTGREILNSGIAPRSGARSLAGGKREARNPRETESGRSPHPCGVRGTCSCPDRGYRSLRSLNPRLHSLHRSAVRCAISKFPRPEASVQFPVSNFEFEMQDSSNFKISDLRCDSLGTVGFYGNLVIAGLFIAVAYGSFFLGRLLDEVRRAAGRARLWYGLVPENEIAIRITRTAVEHLPTFGAPFDQFAAASGLWAGNTNGLGLDVLALRIVAA